MRIRVSTRRVAILAIALTAIVIGMGVALADTSDAAFCSLCKNMDPAITHYQESAHKDVNCEQCHTVPGPFFFLTAKMEALQEPIAQLTGQWEAPIVGHVVNASCRRCHNDEQLFNVISKNGINVSHKHLLEDGFQCMSCHSTVAHGDSVPIGSQTYPTMDKCLVCHNNRYTAPDGSVAVSRCDLCHVEPPKSAKPVTHGDDWLVTHGSLGNLATCSACHRGKNACSRCHGGVEMPHDDGWLTDHGPTVSQVGRAACSKCHDSKAYCNTCHQVKMPHPGDFIGKHAVAAANSKQTCFNCHEVATCQSCHDAHNAGDPAAHDLLTAKPTPAASKSSANGD